MKLQIVAYCAGCTKPLTIETWWKIYGKNLCASCVKVYEKAKM